jgi:hypothetical protein
MCAPTCAGWSVFLASGYWPVRLVMRVQPPGCINRSTIGAWIAAIATTTVELYGMYAADLKPGLLQSSTEACSRS